MNLKIQPKKGRIWRVPQDALEKLTLDHGDNFCSELSFDNKKLKFQPKKENLKGPPKKQVPQGTSHSS